jgi:prevent-host-death family protein
MPEEQMDVVTLRSRLGQILDRVFYQGLRVTVTKNGTPIAALVPLEEWHRLRGVNAVATTTVPRKKGKARA